MLISRGGRVVQDSWTARAGPLAMQFWPKHGRSADGRLSCEDEWCVYRPPNHQVALVKQESALAQACAGGFDVVVSAVPIRNTCAGAKVVIDRFDVWRRGAYEIWLNPDGTTSLQNVADWQGDRPWSFHPKSKFVHHTEPMEEAVPE